MPLASVKEEPQRHEAASGDGSCAEIAAAAAALGGALAEADLDRVAAPVHHLLVLVGGGVDLLLRRCCAVFKNVHWHWLSISKAPTTPLKDHSQQVGILLGVSKNLFLV